MKHLMKAAALAAFALASSAFTQQAHASFRVRIDNKATGEALAWAGTSNVITVRAQNRITGLWATVGSRVLSTISESHNFDTGLSINNLNLPLSPAHWPAEDVAVITVSINGANMFYLDQVELFAQNPVTGAFVFLKKRGEDNRSGWCLSTQTSPPDTAPECNPTNATSVTPQLAF